MEIGKRLYDLELHESLSIPMQVGVMGGYTEKWLTVVKVPGGWLYCWEDGSGVFVPFSMSGYKHENLHEAMQYINKEPGMTVDLAISILSAVKHG